jgi:hypothetical protein
VKKLFSPVTMELVLKLRLPVEAAPKITFVWIYWVTHLRLLLFARVLSLFFFHPNQDVTKLRLPVDPAEEMWGMKTLPLKVFQISPSL